MADHVLDRSILWSLVGSEMPSDGAVLAVDYSVAAAGGVDLDDVTRVRTEGRLVRDIGKGISSFDAFDTGAFLCTGGVFDALRDASRRVRRRCRRGCTASRIRVGWSAVT